MTLDEFVARFAEEFDETPVEAFKADTVFKNLDEWGSLTALSVASMIEEEYDKRITGANLRSVSTIEELYHLVESK